MKKTLLIPLLMLIHGFCYGVIPDNIRQWSIGDGLSQSEVRTINRDSKGTMWFGTVDGLNRFDGYEFRKYVRNPFDETSLSNDYINTTFEDSKGDLWIGTNRGLNKFSFKTGKIHRIKDPGVKAGYVSAIEQAPSGNLLVGSQFEVLKIYRKNNAYFSSPLLTNTDSKDPKARITCIRKSITGGFWICKTNGLQKIMLDQSDRITANTSFGFEEDKFKNYRIRKCQEDADQNLWVLAELELFMLKKGESLIKKAAIDPELLPRQVTSMMVDKFGILWVGSTNDGVFRYKILKGGKVEFLDRVGISSQVPNLSNKTILTFYESSEKNDDDVWIGTGEAGVFQFSRSKNNYHHWHQYLKNEPAYSRSFFSIYPAANGEIWAGTLEGLLRFSKDGKTYKKYAADRKRPEKNVYQSILEDSRGHLWVGSNEGLYLFDRNKESFTPFVIPQANGRTPVVMKVYEDKFQGVWVGTSEYLLKINPDKSFEIFQYAFLNGKKTKLGSIGDIHQESANVYWIGTSHGLYEFDGKKVVREFTYQADKPDGLLENLILDVFVSPTKDVWVSSSKGLSKMVKNKNKITFRHYTEKDGLPNSFVYGVVSDARNNIWFSTNKGIGFLNIQTGVIKNYQENDGLGGNEFNSNAFARSHTGELFFGGINALVSFNPEAFTENNHVPKLAVSSMKIDETDINADSIIYNKVELAIPHTQNNLRLQLSSLDFTNPDKNEYAYRIRGIHNNWINNGNQRQLAFFDLPYGRFVLELISSNNNGIWNEQQVLKIPLNVVPPFWRTYWFYALVLVGVSVAAYIFYRNRLQARLKFLVALETVRLEENERVRKIASQDMHDEFGNSLTRISILTELIKTRINQKNEKEAMSMLTKIADNSNRLYQGTKDFIWSINAENDNLFEIAIRIKDFCEEVLDNSGKAFSCEGISEKMRDINLNPGASRHVVMIFKEAVMNSLKHSEADQVKLSFDVGDEEVEVCWEDNGKGFEGCENKGLGLTNMKNRADRIRSEIRIVSKQGTKIFLKTPFRTKA